MVQKIEGDARALKPGGLCCRESVKGGGRDALNGVWERRRKLRQRPPFSAAFLVMELTEVEGFPRVLANLIDFDNLDIDERIYHGTSARFRGSPR